MVMRGEVEGTVVGGLIEKGKAEIVVGAGGLVISGGMLKGGWNEE